MARFRYLGEPPRSYVASYGPTILIKVQKKDGTQQTLTPVAPATSFVIGEDIGYDITDERSVRQLRADPRYEEIV